MKAVITFLILAIVAYGLHRIFCRMSIDDPYENSPEAEGTITKITDSDSGNLRFYVSFVTNEGVLVEGQSVYYTKTKGRYKRGDRVRVKYNVVSKDRVRVKLIDPELDSRNNSLESASKVTLIASLLFLFIAIARVMIHFV